MRGRSFSGRCAAGLLAVLAALAVGCGGDDEADREAPADQVRGAASTYLQALRSKDWDKACGLMTPAAQREVEDVVGEKCARALASGGALPAEQLAAIGRELPRAKVSVRGDAATIGPLGELQQPLRLERREDRWLIAG